MALVAPDTANKIHADLVQLAFGGRARAAAIRAGAELTERQARTVRRGGTIALRSGLTAATAIRRQASTRAGTSLLSGALGTLNIIGSGIERFQRLRT